MNCKKSEKWEHKWLQGDAPTNTGDPGSGFATELTVLGAWTPLLMEESLVKPGCLARHYLAPQVPVVVGHLQRFALQRTREQPPIRNSQQPATSHITSPITMSWGRGLSRWRWPHWNRSCWKADLCVEGKLPSMTNCKQTRLVHGYYSCLPIIRGVLNGEWLMVFVGACVCMAKEWDQGFKKVILGLSSGSGTYCVDLMVALGLQFHVLSLHVLLLYLSSTHRGIIIWICAMATRKTYNGVSQD